MDTKQLVSLLTGAVIASSGLTYTATELIDGKVPKEETPIIEEQLPAVQPVIMVDEKCADDSLLLRIGTAELCTSAEVYEELKTVIVDDLKTVDTVIQKEDGTVCEEVSEECKKTTYDLNLGNRDLFYAVLVKEMIKDGEIKDLSENREEAKAEALEILEGKKELEIIK